MLNLYDNGTISEYDKNSMSKSGAACVAAANFSHRATPEIIPLYIFRYVFNNEELVTTDTLKICNYQPESPKDSLWSFYVNTNDSVNITYASYLNENISSFIDSYTNIVPVDFIDRNRVFSYDEEKNLVPFLYDPRSKDLIYYSTEEAVPEKVLSLIHEFLKDIEKFKFFTPSELEIKLDFKAIELINGD